MPKSRNVVWYRRIHSKINFAITVIPIAVRWRVKYEQKSRHRYHVYVNLFSKIDEQDVTANIRPLVSLPLSPSLSYIAASEYTFAVCTCSCAIHLHLFPFGDPCILYFPDWPDASRSARHRFPTLVRWLLIPLLSALILVHFSHYSIRTAHSLSCRNSVRSN